MPTGQEAKVLIVERGTLAVRRCRDAPATLPFEVRFETPPGRQAQVDFAQFQVVFADEPAVTRIVWLFSLVLGSSRWLWARFVRLRCKDSDGASVTHSWFGCQA